MSRFCYWATLILFLITLDSCSQQVKDRPIREKLPDKKLGGGCEGCEIMFVGMPTNLNSTDTSAGWAERGQKLLITGTVLHKDGTTPAKDVILYYWQTDNNGYYSPSNELEENAKRHGHIRGWLKTDANGKYSIYTIRPAPYPNENIPAHIHISIKEPYINNEYYIDDLVFDDDKLLTGEARKVLENRGGSGILRILAADNIQIAEHNIVLGLNIPNYPESHKSRNQSGLEIGEDSPSFIPFHAWGPDKGTRTCPVCKYGRYQGIIYFVGNNPDWNDIKKWLSFLEQESMTRSKYLKAYFVYGNEIKYEEASRRMELEKLGQELKLRNTALTFVPSFNDIESEVNLNKINPAVSNTFIIYKHRNIVGKIINLPAEPTNFKRISSMLDKTRGDYFDLSEVDHK